MLVPPANRPLSELIAAYSLPMRSVVVRFLPGVSRGVVGSSPLFCTVGICVCGCTIGVWSSPSLSLEVRFVMLATAASDDSGREGPAGVGLPSCVARAYPMPTSEEAVGDMAGTPGEKRLTCGDRAMAALPAACPAESGHVSPVPCSSSPASCPAEVLSVKFILERSLSPRTGAGPSGVIYGEGVRGGDDGSLHKHTRTLMRQTIRSADEQSGQWEGETQCHGGTSTSRSQASWCADSLQSLGSDRRRRPRAQASLASAALSTSRLPTPCGGTRRAAGSPPRSFLPATVAPRPIEPPRVEMS
jgi:hypothetical protein